MCFQYISLTFIRGKIELFRYRSASSGNLVVLYLMIHPRPKNLKCFFPLSNTYEVSIPLFMSYYSDILDALWRGCCLNVVISNERKKRIRSFQLVHNAYTILPHSLSDS